MDKTICVYSCISGNYDTVNELTFKEEKIDYYLFTNNKNLTSKTWKVIYVNDPEISDIYLARKIKILGYPEITDKYDLTICIDGSIIIKNSIIDFLKKECKLDKYSMVGFKHSQRDCAYEEAIACVKFHKDSSKNVERIIKNFKKNKYPQHNGLIESGILVRKNNDSKVKETMKLWYKLLCEYSPRDQLSFNYAAYQTKLEIKYLNMNIFNNHTFQCLLHSSLKKIKKYRIYFGDENHNYDFKYDEQGEYVPDDNGVYKIKSKVLRDTDTILFEPDMFIIGIYYTYFNVKGEKVSAIYPKNVTEIENSKLFLDFIPQIVINGNFKKGQLLEIEGDFKIATEEKWQNFVRNQNTIINKQIEKYNNDIQELQENINRMQKEKIEIEEKYSMQTIELEKLKNSKGWRLLEKLRKFRRW